MTDRYRQVCVVFDCNRWSAQKSLKCEAHQGKCPTCGTEDITTKFGYCDDCWSYHLDNIKNNPAQKVANAQLESELMQPGLVKSKAQQNSHIDFAGRLFTVKPWEQQPKPPAE